MIAKHKLSKAPDYKKLFKRPPLLVSKDFSLWLATNQHVGFTRFGVVIAKKHVKTAVSRNYAKRTSKELFKNYKSLFNNKDVILVIKKARNVSNAYIWKKKLAGVYSWLNHFGC